MITILPQLLLCWRFLCQRPILNGLDTIWLTWTAVVIATLWFHPYLGVVLFIGLVNCHTFRVGILSVLTIILTAICRQHIHILRPMAQWLFLEEFRWRIEPQIETRGEILVLNYPANFVEYLCPLLFTPMTLLIAPDPVDYLVRFLFDAESYIRCAPNCFDEATTRINVARAAQRTIIAYLERKIDERTSVHSFAPRGCRTGLLSIARQNNIPIRPVYVPHLIHTWGIIESPLAHTIIIGDHLDITKDNSVLTDEILAFWTTSAQRNRRELFHDLSTIIDN